MSPGALNDVTVIQYSGKTVMTSHSPRKANLAVRPAAVSLPITPHLLLLARGQQEEDREHQQR